MSSNQITQNQLVSWINEAGLALGKKKADLLRKIIELLMHQASDMIPQYLDTILSWTNDKSTDVKKQIVFLIEELSKLQPDYLPQIVPQLLLMLSDSVVAIQKRVLQAGGTVYKNALAWISQGNAAIQEKKKVWEQITKLKLQIATMIDSENEGLRTQTVKFLEEVVLLQSYSDSIDNAEFSLEKIPFNLPFIKRNVLEEESAHIFDLLIKFHNSQHISSVNLMACMTTICTICKVRPKYMCLVIKAFSDLHTTLPPTLSQSQVNSVRKHLRSHLTTLLKHPGSNELFPQITQLLLDTGMSNQEVAKLLPRERRYKRLGESKESTSAKRIKLDLPIVVEEKAEPIDIMDVTEDSIFQGLNNVESVANLVFDTLFKNLPEAMPSSFTIDYKPIPNAGSATQRRNLAKLIINIIHIVEETPAIEPMQYLSNQNAKIPLLKDEDEKVTLRSALSKLQETTKVDKLAESSKIESAVSKLMEETRQEHLKEQEKLDKEKGNKDKEVEEPVKLIPPPTPTIPKLKQRVKLLKLQEITRPIPKEIKEKLILQAVERILRAENEVMIGGAAQIRMKLITTFASSYTSEIRELVLNFILEEPMSRIDLAIGWLYEEFSYYQGYQNQPVTLQPKFPDKCDLSYNNLLCALITQINERGDPLMENCKDVLLRRIYLEAPLITEEAIDYVKALINDEKMSILCLDIIEDLCIMRTPHAGKYVTALVAHTLNAKEDIRETALKSVLKLYKKGTESIVKVVDKYAKVYLGFIALNSPPSELVNDYHVMTNHNIWTDDQYKLCLLLIMSLFPIKEELILEVARVYGHTSAEGKRCVLRAIETPVRQVIASNPGTRPAFLKLLEECPRGSETLLTRLVHILTEKSPPSMELVSRVRELYATRVSDVRFLIPVLNGLTKKEILAALPKLIKLNPVVVKEVFNKLLGQQNINEETLPVSPTELLVTLHLIDPNQADLKYIIRATALCFAEKTIYTQEVVSGVLQILVEEDPIPVLLMRSVLQSLAVYPALSGLVLNILQRLIDKDVWTNKVAWEGWIKCCERVLPESVSVLLKLPAAPFLASVGAASLRAAVRARHAGLTPAQRSILPSHIQQILGPTESEFGDSQYQIASNEPLLPPGMEE